MQGWSITDANLSGARIQDTNLSGAKIDGVPVEKPFEAYRRVNG